MEISLKKLKTLRDSSGALLNPRGEPGDTTDLQTTLATEGQIDPIVVGPADEKGNYPIIHGHRRVAALLAIKAKTAKVFVDEQIDLSNEDALRRKMLATTTSIRVKPSARGQYMLNCMMREVDPWPIEKAAAIIGVEPSEAKLYVRLAELAKTEPNFVQRVDEGEIAWTVFRNRLAKAPATVRDQVAKLEKPTREAVETVVRKATKPQESNEQLPGLRGEDVIAGLNQARRAIQRALEVLLTAHPATAERIDMLLDEIARDMMKENEANA